jgi:hypothetical protein
MDWDNLNPFWQNSKRAISLKKLNGELVHYGHKCKVGNNYQKIGNNLVKFWKMRGH